MTAPDDADLAAVRRWFERLASHVRTVDFAGARPIFAEDMVAFGTFTDFMTGRDKAEAAQWRNVWPHIDEFRWRPDIRAIVSPDRLTAIGMGIFDSTGYTPDGTPYPRPGRATVAFTRKRAGDDWVAAHTHMSLFRDVPTRSHKKQAGEESMSAKSGISIERVDHIGIRVRDLDRAMAFYGALGFELHHKVTFDAVAIIKNRVGVEINLILNANAGDPAKNILMDVPEKYAGYTHVALGVASIADTIAALKSHDIAITQGPVTFGDGGTSVFIRDPDRNVIELRSHATEQVGAKQYVPG